MTFPNPLSKSAQLFERASRVIPGSTSRLTIKSSPYHLFLSSAQGAKVVDVDGNELLDFNNNYTSLIHGHAHPAINQAVQKQLSLGTAYSFSNEAEIELAELLCERLPSMDRIRFVNSGSEAVMNAIKAARAYTGRFKIAKCEGGYHGSYDNAEVSLSSTPKNWGTEVPQSVEYSKGTPESVLEETIVIPYNDTDSAEQILEVHASELAAVLFDPLPNRIGLIPIQSEFVKMLERFAKKHQALLILDEVITLRNGYSGTQGVLGLTPDLTTVAKIIGGGFPVGAVGGRADVMQVFEADQQKPALPHGGTFNANPVTMAAGKTCMELFNQEEIDQLNAKGKFLRAEIENVFKSVNVPGQVTGEGSLFRIHLHNRVLRNYRDSYSTKTENTNLSLLHQHLINEGVYLSSGGFGCLSTAMNGADLSHFLEALLKSLRQMEECFEV